jgi:prevent-host-death family protein
MVNKNGQMKSVAVSQFKAHCLALLDDVARTGQPLLVVRHGKPLARVLPSSRVAAEQPQCTLRGTVTYLGDIIEPALPAAAWESRLPEPATRAKRR